MQKIIRLLFVISVALLITSGLTGAYIVDGESSIGNSLTAGTAPAQNIVLNEIYPNPPGSSEANSEWLELYNKGDWAWNVNGWRLVDFANNSMVIDGTKTGGSTVVPPHGWLVVNRNGNQNFSLNNDSETISLYNAGMLIDSFHYTTTTEAKSWGRKPDGIGAWFNDLTPTPGATNGL